MAFRGERFVLDLDDDDIPEASAASSFDLIGEIRERDPTSANPPAPTPPKLTSSTTGFPAHRRRNKPSSFKQRRTQEEQPATSATDAASPTVQVDKISIARENNQQLASMSDAQIQQEREELMASMDPGLLQRFLHRARVDEDERASDTPTPTSESQDPLKPKKKSVSFDVPLSHQPAKAPTAISHSYQPAPPTISNPPRYDDAPPTQLPADLHPASEHPSLDPALLETFHFPQPRQPMPSLDPSSPNFLSDLQSHYFPEISHDPSGLSWLQPPSTDEEDPESTSAYHPASSAISLAPSAIRFSLRGTILAPNTSLSLPTTLGLHHHGDDPQAAGYTIPELAILSRSTFPAQRCIAWQVLGRILFRLGRAEFGDRGGQLSEGLWFVIEKEGVVNGMLAEAEGAAGQDLNKARAMKEDRKDGDTKAATPLASGIGRHASAAAWAVEGVWLWQKGGGGDRGLLKEGQIRSQ